MIELLPHDQFARLRLAQFAPPGAEIAQPEDWEYLDRLWVGEAIGFSEWLRPADRPDELGSLALDLAELPAAVSRSALQRLGLPLVRGMRRQDVEAVLGTPRRTEQFVDDRVTYEFRCGGRWQYDVSCTVQDVAGLIYVTLLPASRPEA